MDGEALVAIVTGSFTLIGVAGGAWFTYWHAKRLADESRAESRRDAQRQVIIEVVAAGRAKVELFGTLLPFLIKLWKGPMGELIAFTKTDTGEKMGRTNENLTRALIHASLLAGDERVVQALDRLRQRNQAFSDDVTGMALKDDLSAAYANLRELNAALVEVEVAARGLLRVPVATEKSRGIRQNCVRNAPTDRVHREQRNDQAAASASQA